MKKILAVDDDEPILALYRHLLRARGYAVCTTSNPMEALALLDREQPDLVLLDIRMPVKDGFGVLEDLKTRAVVPPVLFVTAFPDSFDVSSERIMKMWRETFFGGHADILYKPFKPEHLFEKIELLVGPADSDAT